MGKSKTIEEQQKQNAAVSAYLKSLGDQLQADVDQASKELDSRREKYFQDAEVTDAKPFLQGKNSDIQLVSEWSLENIQKILIKIRDVVFSINDAPDAGKSLPDNVKVSVDATSQMTSVAALANLNIFLAAKAFDAIASILAAFTTGNFTTVQKSEKTEMVAPGITMFLTVIEKTQQNKDFFNNETHTQNIFLYEFWFSFSQATAASQFNDLQAYENLKAGFRARMTALGNKIADVTTSFDDVQKLQNQIDYYGKQLKDLTAREAELQQKKNESIQAEAFRSARSRQAEMAREYQAFVDEQRRTRHPQPLEPTRSSTEDTEVLPGIGERTFLVEESICGEDTRIQVSDSNVEPYYAICSLLITMRDGTRYLGSGWLASFKDILTDDKWINHVVMTSGHCVFAGGEFAKSITVIPGRDGAISPYGQFTAPTEAMRASKEWQNNPGAIEKGSDYTDYDYGAILIPRVQAAGWGAMSWVDLPSEDLTSKIVINTGYPADKPSGSLWTAQGPITAVTPRKIQYMNDTYGGQSGSPAYLNEDKLRVVGIHGYGGCPNKAVRLTRNVVQDMCAWASEDLFK